MHSNKNACNSSSKKVWKSKAIDIKKTQRKATKKSKPNNNGIINEKGTTSKDTNEAKDRRAKWNKFKENKGKKGKYNLYI